VSNYTGAEKPNPYLLTPTYHPVNDATEPNDDTAHATPITLGQNVSGYFFAGLEDSTRPPESVWQDRYKVTLPAGDATISLTNVASDMNGEIRVFNALGSEIAAKSDATLGASVILNTTIAAADAGECVILVHPHIVETTEGTGATVPVFYTQPYSLVVTAP
jgi:hypothetical protein